MRASSGIAVIATNTWSAQQGRQKLKISWDFGPNASHDSIDATGDTRQDALVPDGGGAVVPNRAPVAMALGQLEHALR